MKTLRFVAVGSALAGTLFAIGCSGVPGMKAGTAGQDINTTGPTILNERAIPKTIELNRSLQPLQTPEILADVKDFRSNVANVKMSFLHVPIEVPMKNIGGTTWRATLSPKEIRQLAVSGQTAQYEANIVAKDEKGQVAVSSNPIKISIKAPDLAQTSS